MKQWVYPFGVFVIFNVVLEALIHNEMISKFILPAPSQIYSTLINDRMILFSAFLESGIRSSIALLIAIAFGFLGGLLLGSFKVLRYGFGPYSVFFQTVPIIAIAPLLVIWFGLGSATVIATAVFVSVFPILNATLFGMTQHNSNFDLLFRVLQVPQLKTLIKLRIPAAIPHLLNSLKVAAGLGVIGTIVGEFITGSGLGGLMDSAKNQMRLDLLFASVLLSCILGLFFVGAIYLLTRGPLKRWTYF